MEQLKNARDTLKQIGGLVGAVDGKYIERVRDIVQDLNITTWQVERLIELVNFLIERLEEGYQPKATVEYARKELERIKEKGREKNEDL